MGEYLKYAIGEIVLVVIGILIALQINNWNEVRKTRIAEIEIYKEIKNDISVSLRDLENGKSTHISGIKESSRLRDYLMKELPFYDKIATDLHYADIDDQFFPKTSGFEALKSIGFETLSNDTLRQRITDLYQLSFVRIVEMGRNGAQSRSIQFLKTYEKYIKLNKDSSRYRKYSENDSLLVYRPLIKNLELLNKDEQLAYDLQEAISLRRFKLRNYNSVINKSNELLLKIDEELNRLEN